MSGQVELSERRGLSRRTVLQAFAAGVAAVAATNSTGSAEEILAVGSGIAAQESGTNMTSAYSCDSCRNKAEGRCGADYTANTPSGVCGNYDPDSPVWDKVYNEEGVDGGFGPKLDGVNAGPRIEQVKPCFRFDYKRRSAARRLVAA